MATEWTDAFTIWLWRSFQRLEKFLFKNLCTYNTCSS